MKYLCIIPAKAESTRIPGKNMVDLCGKPMVQYTLEAAKDCGLFDMVVTSSDDMAIVSLAPRFGSLGVIRPEELCQPQTRVAEVCLYIIEKQLEGSFDRFCLLLPTNPLRTAADITVGLSYFSLVPKPKFAMSVSEYSFNAHYALVSDIYKSSRLVSLLNCDLDVPRQQFPSTYYVDGAVYWADMDAFLAYKSISPMNSATVFFQIPKERALEVDEPIDLILAEALLRRRGEKS